MAGKVLEDNTTDVNGRDQSVIECDDKKRKAHLVARQRIQRCLMDNGTSVLFAFPGRMSRLIMIYASRTQNIIIYDVIFMYT